MKKIIVSSVELVCEYRGKYWLLNFSKSKSSDAKKMFCLFKYLVKIKWLSHMHNAK